MTKIMNLHLLWLFSSKQQCLPVVSGASDIWPEVISKCIYFRENVWETKKGKTENPATFVDVLREEIKDVKHTNTQHLLGLSYNVSVISSGGQKIDITQDFF